MAHRPTDPRSPVQSQRSGTWLPLIVAVFAAVAFWGWQNSDKAVDWLDGDADTRATGPTRAKANLVEIFSTDDYPAAAIRREEQGTVNFSLSINRRGRVTECQVVQSSGSEALDKQTCRILTKRARFDPARNAEGKRIADTYSGRIRWELPEE